MCALGPSSHTVDTLEAMLNAGMVGARIDLTWGGLDFHRESLKALNVSTATHSCQLAELLASQLGTLRPEILQQSICLADRIPGMQQAMPQCILNPGGATLRACDL